MKKYKIPETTWEKVMVDTGVCYHYQIVDVPDQQYTDLTFSVFYFGPNPLTLQQSKKKFKRWLKKFWHIFSANTLVEVWCKIVYFMRLYNSSKQVEPQNYINQLPGFAGKKHRKRNE
jgi:hypothetical protein